jgi:hypothetical protein
VSRLPRQAATLSALAAKLERYFGLRLAYGDFRPVPLARGFVADLMGWRDGRVELERTRAREQLALWSATVIARILGGREGSESSRMAVAGIGGSMSR